MKTIGALIFPQFELLDMFGPLEMFGLLEDQFQIKMVAETAEPVASAQGPLSLADHTISEDRTYDLILVPGGRGTRREVDNPDLIAWLQNAAQTAEIVMSVCTGTALLARAGLLDGRSATTNKAAFSWVVSQGPDVLWRGRARWVEDGKFVTSAGVSAGMDMSLAVISRTCGRETADAVARHAEYDWHDNPDWDPFAALHGLT